MKQIKTSKIRFANGLIGVFCVLQILFLCTQPALAQAVFPLSTTSSNKDNVITITVTNTKQVPYSVRASLFDQTQYNGYTEGNNYPYTVIASGKNTTFTFQHLVAGRTYRAKILATTDVPANPTRSQFSEKDLDFKNGVAAPPPPPPPPPNDPTALPECVSKLTTLVKTTDPNSYYYTDSVHGKVGLFISSKRYEIITTGDIGSWSCDNTNTLVLGTPDSKAVAPSVNPTPTPQTNIPPTVGNASCPIDPRTNKVPECCDGVDNDQDGRADFYGATINGKAYPPDPKCLYKEDTEQDRPTGSEIVPCTDKCNIESVFLLANKIIKFFFTTLLIPIIVILFVYAGISYILAQGNPGKKVKLGKLLWHIVLGVVLILTAWLIVRVVLDALGITDGLIFFG